MRNVHSINSRKSSSQSLTLEQITPQLDSTIRRRDLSAATHLAHRRKRTNCCTELCSAIGAICRRLHASNIRVEPAKVSVPPLLPPQSPEKSGLKTLVLDLDETLVHSSFEKLLDADFVVNITKGPKRGRVYVKKRPGLNEFLRKAAELYEVVVFTASMECYAGPVLDVIDRKRRISHRLFREHCILVQGEYVKDLSRLGRELSKVVIIDVLVTQNSPTAYLLHPGNAFPIRSFISDTRDVELGEALGLLREMSRAEDVTQFLSPHKPELIRRATYGFSALTI